MKVFISGGSKSGKTAYAEKMAIEMRKMSAPMYYIATMIPIDDEDNARIEKHQNDRYGRGFETIEAGRNILEAIKVCEKNATCLLDSVTALLANEIFTNDGSVDTKAAGRVGGELLQILANYDDIVIVSDNIYSDAFIYDDATELYRRELAKICKQIAGACDLVLEVFVGMIIAHKDEKE